MAEFINTSEGFLNLAHILWVKFGAGGEEGFDLLQMSDGRLVRCQVQDPLFKPSLRNRAPEYPEAQPDPRTCQDHRHSCQVQLTGPGPGPAENLGFSLEKSGLIFACPGG